MVKNQKLFTRNTHAISEVISVVIMMVIEASVAGVALHVSMGLTCDLNIRKIPMVNMAKDEDIILIYGAQFDPIIANDIKIIVGKK
jgi:hypothetical protein